MNAYILVRGDITVTAAPSTEVSFKNCAPFAKCITEIDGTTIDDAEDLDLDLEDSSYSETTGSLWFYSKNETTNFNADITNTNTFESFKYKAKLVGNAVTQDALNQANGILENVLITVPLKYSSNLWRSLEIPSINCKGELKLKWTKYLVSSGNGKDNIYDDNNDNDIISTITDTKLFVPLVTLSTRHNQKFSKLLSKRFEGLLYWNEYKIKSENKNTTNEYRYFLDSNFVGVKRLLVLVYSNQDKDSKISKTQRYYLRKGIIDNYNVIINGKNIYDHAVDSDIKQYEEIRKLTTGKVEGYTTGCLLDYDYIKNYYRLIEVDLSRQKELDADPKVIPQVEFQPMFV